MEIPKSKWTIQQESSELDVTIKCRPNIEIEESFLSEKTWTPGKAQWLPFTFSVPDNEDGRSFLESIQDWTTIKLKYGTQSYNEIWTMNVRESDKKARTHVGDRVWITTEVDNPHLNVE